MSDDKLTDATNEIATARSNTTIENLKASLTGYRNLLQLDNGLVQLINTICVGVGLGVYLQTSAPTAYAGAVLAAIGVLGYLDAIIGRLQA